MAVKIWKSPIEVRNRLDELDLTEEQLIEVIAAMIAARADCTDNDPPGSRGWSSYRMGTRRLREVKRSDEGWSKDDTDQISSVVNAELGIRAAVSNTDDGTGIDDEERFPQNRSKKGAATDRAVQGNQQGSFMDTLDESMNVIPLRPGQKPPIRMVTWYLCVYSEGDEHRAELSLPIGLEGGFFTGFKERIIIGGPDDGGGAIARKRMPDDGNGSGFDIPVIRKRP